MPDQWIQAAFKVPWSKLAANPYPKRSQYRLYINPTGDGIPPGGNITLTLPLYSQLVPTDSINPLKPDQFADWWGGGRIEIFDGLAATHKPPPALTANYTGTNLPARGKQVKVTPIAGAALPALSLCKPSPCQPLTIFKDPAGLGNNEPSLLTEYTLGAIEQQPLDAPFAYALDEHNVDYDVSYVDAAYLPAAMEPFNNDQVGYIGTIQDIGTFRNALNKFLGPTSAYKGWPQFVDDQKATILKVPSPINIFAGAVNPNPRTDITKGPWPPIETLKANWKTCTLEAGTATICANMRQVRRLFQDNFNNYAKIYPTSCDTTKPFPLLTEPFMISHVYGWTPFNENCNNAKANLLEDTPGYFTLNLDKTKNYAKYQAVKASFDKLQYWPWFPKKPTGDFDPYLLLIHGEDYVNAPFVYAYSVDDAVGNMQVAGDGLIIAVGGVGGLPNPNHATPPINVGIGFEKTNRINFTRYGLCTTDPKKVVKPVNPAFASFAYSSTNAKSCPLTFVDNEKDHNTIHSRSRQSRPSLR